tara:strand:+ start:100 stop:411 length:312 start_codon:yes stop_codon:yes gene_type:complete
MQVIIKKYQLSGLKVKKIFLEEKKYNHNLGEFFLLIKKKLRNAFINFLSKNNASCRIRTCGPLLRRQLLYPAELRKHLIIISDCKNWYNNNQPLTLKLSILKG